MPLTNATSDHPSNMVGAAELEAAIVEKRREDREIAL
jgi:hypothetical protein